MCYKGEIQKYDFVLCVLQNKMSMIINSISDALLFFMLNAFCFLIQIMYDDDDVDDADACRLDINRMSGLFVIAAGQCLGSV